jgi:hypothetical protein
MFSTSKPRKYRQIIDELLDVSMNTTGQINVRRVRDGNWPRIDGEASPLGVPEVDDAFARIATDNNDIADLVSRLSEIDRKVIARMLSDQVFLGVFEALKVLEANEVPLFKDGYEGSPFDDLMARRDGWQWPQR